MKKKNLRHYADELPEDVLYRLRTDYGQDFDYALLSLGDFLSCSTVPTYVGERNRIVRCIIHLAEGDLHRLRQVVVAAVSDWRDVIVAAEYESGTRVVNDFAQPWKSV